MAGAPPGRGVRGAVPTALQVTTLVSMIPNFWCSLEVAAAELHLCFVIKGSLWWKGTFLPMVLLSLCYIINK